MLDSHLFRNKESSIFTALNSRGVKSDDINTLQHLTERRFQSIAQAEQLRSQHKQATAALQQALQQHDLQAAAIVKEKLKINKESSRIAIEQANQAETDLQAALLHVPNLPLIEVPEGKDEQDNQLIKVWQEPKSTPFTAKPHWDLVETLDIVNFTQARTISGARFAIFKGAGARLERALATFMLDIAQEHGYLEISVPLLVNPQAMLAAGQYPKFMSEAFATVNHDYALIPTSEVPLVNLHQDSILDGTTLPLRYTAYSPCFRREAGAAGKDTRGLIRLHQFPKVELVSITTPETSSDEHERLTHIAEIVLERLELPYRRMLLCRQDMGFAAAKTYDLEVWLPSSKTYREISSCSNCTDFQARRAKIRYRPAPQAKPQLVHTLNGSALAVGRALVAVIENYQQEKGSIAIPQALVSYFGEKTIFA